MPLPTFDDHHAATGTLIETESLSFHNFKKICFINQPPIFNKCTSSIVQPCSSRLCCFPIDRFQRKRRLLAPTSSSSSWFSSRTLHFGWDIIYQIGLSTMFIQRAEWRLREESVCWLTLRGFWLIVVVTISQRWWKDRLPLVVRFGGETWGRRKVVGIGLIIRCDEWGWTWTYLEFEVGKGLGKAKQRREVPSSVKIVSCFCLWCVYWWIVTFFRTW